MKWGFDKGIWDSFGAKYPLEYSFESHPHALICGCSGSGKSYSILYELSQFIFDSYTYGIKPIVYICDFKNSEDFQFLMGYPLYYAGNECYEGMEEFYQQFTATRQKGIVDKEQRHLMVFDEYASAVSYYQSQDKLTKGKTASSLISMNAEMLMLSRSFNYGVWTCVQYGTSDLFHGARLNYMINLSLGRQNREQLNMLFSGEEIPQNRIYQPGEGLLLADGFPLKEVKYPLVDMVQLKQFIRRMLFKAIC